MKVTISKYSANQIMKATQRGSLVGGLPFCRYSFSSMTPKSARIGGAGLYACFHRNRLIYIGKYRGASKDWRLGDIVSLRWIKHVGTFTMQARNLGFSKRALLEIQEAISQSNSSELCIPGDIIDGFRIANSKVLQRETGCMTTFQRFKVALDVWNQIEDLSEPNLHDFDFVYARIDGKFSNPEARELVSAAETRALGLVHPLGNTISGRREMALPDPAGVAELFAELLRLSNPVESVDLSKNRSSREILDTNQINSEPEENMPKFQQMIEEAPDFTQDFVSELQSRFADLDDADIEFTNMPDMRVRKLTGKANRGFRNCVRFEWQPRKKRFLMYSQLSDNDLGNFDLSVDKIRRSDVLSNITFLTEERLANSRAAVLEAILHAHKVFKL